MTNQPYDSSRIDAQINLHFVRWGDESILVLCEGDPLGYIRLRRIQTLPSHIVTLAKKWAGWI